ncbi:amino acid permease-domain-containing protein [Aspergillus recurvatus]
MALNEKETEESVPTETMEKPESTGQVEQHLNKVYNVWTASAYQMLMMASWTCNLVLYSTVMTLGGPMMLIYSTARRFLSYCTGWVVLMGEIGTAAGIVMNSAQIIGGVVQLSQPHFELTRWVTFLIYAALLILSLLFSLSQRYLPAVAILGGFITLFGGIVWAATFLALSPKRDTSFVFTEFINSSGYTSSAWVGIMSFYTPVYALYGTDGILHIAEEMQEAEKSAPRAMIWSIIFSGITSLLGALVMGFCIGDWEAYLETDFPIIPWFVDTLNGSVTGGSTMVLIVIVFLNFLIAVSVNVAGSRLAWGMARDQALPWSNFFFRINRKLETPLHSTLLVVAAELALGFVVFGSNYAFQAIVSMGNAAIQLGYLIPILVVPHPLDVVFFLLALTITWTSCSFPLSVPINSENIMNMNWAVMMVGAVVILVTVDWFFRGRYHYQV